MYKRTLSPIMEKHGYTGALWCAFFSIRMFHDPDPNDPQRSIEIEEWESIMRRIFLDKFF